jgi:hypothetical protein
MVYLRPRPSMLLVSNAMSSNMSAAAHGALRVPDQSTQPARYSGQPY